MNDDAGARPAERRRPWAILATALALLLTHHLTALAAARGFRPLVHGYVDAELLAPGGDLALELVSLHEEPLLAALAAAGAWLLAGRIPGFLAAFFLYRVAFAWAWFGPLRARPSSVRPLHTLLALPTVLVTTLASSAFAGALLFGLVQLRRALLRADVMHATAIFWCAAVVGAVLWTMAAAWLDLHRLAVAGARLGPWSAARSASDAWRRNLPRLAAARGALGGLTLAATSSGALLLSAMTRGERPGQLVAALTLDLGLLGAVCLRAAWLTWASAHLPAVAPDGAGTTAEPEATASAADLSPASSAAALPSEGPDVPGDPSPGPDA